MEQAWKKYKEEDSHGVEHGVEDLIGDVAAGLSLSTNFPIELPIEIASFLKLDEVDNDDGFWRGPKDIGQIYGSWSAYNTESSGATSQGSSGLTSRGSY